MVGSCGSNRKRYALAAGGDITRVDIDMTVQAGCAAKLTA